MTNELDGSQWIACARPNPGARMRLFGLPYAGGGAGIFRRWHLHLPQTVEVLGIQLPGRGSRLREEPLTRTGPLLDSLSTELSPYLDRPFAIFGHSLGAMLAFELVHRLQDEQNMCASHLFVGGRRAPQVPASKQLTYDLPHDEFVAELRRLNGTPREVLEHPEMMELMIPILRADFEVSETYTYAPREALRVGITAFGGTEDEDVPREEVELWSAQTRAGFRVHMLPGDHFFLHAAERELLRLISQDLDTVLARA